MGQEISGVVRKFLKSLNFETKVFEFSESLIFKRFLNFSFFHSFPNSPPKIIRSFMGTIEEANIYLENGFYVALTGYLCKVSLILFIHHETVD